MSPSESVLSSSPNDSTAPTTGWEKAGRRLGTILYVILSLEIGTFLLVMPWSVFWDWNTLLYHYPVWRILLMNLYLRGAVSGLGLVNLWLGVSRVWDFRRPAPSQAAGD